MEAANNTRNNTARDDRFICMICNTELTLELAFVHAMQRHNGKMLIVSANQQNQ